MYIFHLCCFLSNCLPKVGANISHGLATRLVTGHHHVPHEERLQQLCLHPLHRQLVWVDLIVVFKIFTGLLDMDPSIFFFLPIAPD